MKPKSFICAICLLLSLWVTNLSAGQVIVQTDDSWKQSSNEAYKAWKQIVLSESRTGTLLPHSYTIVQTQLIEPGTAQVRFAVAAPEASYDLTIQSMKSVPLPDGGVSRTPLGSEIPYESNQIVQGELTCHSIAVPVENEANTLRITISYSDESQESPKQSIMYVILNDAPNTMTVTTTNP